MAGVAEKRGVAEEGGFNFGEGVWIFGSEMAAGRRESTVAKW